MKITSISCFLVWMTKYGDGLIRALVGSDYNATWWWWWGGLFSAPSYLRNYGANLQNSNGIR